MMASSLLVKEREVKVNNVVFRCQNTKERQNIIGFKVSSRCYSMLQFWRSNWSNRRFCSNFLCTLVSSINWLPPYYIRCNINWQIALKGWQSETVVCFDSIKVQQLFAWRQASPHSHCCLVQFWAAAAPYWYWPPLSCKINSDLLPDFVGLRQPASASKVHPVGAAACTDAAPGNCPEASTPDSSLHQAWEGSTGVRIYYLS